MPEQAVPFVKQGLYKFSGVWFRLFPANREGGNKHAGGVFSAVLLRLKTGTPMLIWSAPPMRRR